MLLSSLLSGWILSVVHAVVLKPFWLPEDSKDNNLGSLPVSFPALQVLRDPGEELSEEAACSLSTLCAEYLLL